MANPVKPIGGQSIRIIHLSDVHFGDKHKFGGEVGPKGESLTKGGYLTLAKSIVDDLEKLDRANSIRDKPPQIVCLTGDLTEKASKEEFKRARKFCEDIAPLGPLAIVPGNHDIDWSQKERADRMEPWQTFLNGLRRKTFDDWSEDERDILVRMDLADSHSVIVVEVNSNAWVEKDTPTEQRGQISQNALAELNVRLSELQVQYPEIYKSCIKVALVHHHPVLIPDLAEPNRGYDSIHGGVHLLRSLRDHGFHLLMHGHKHIPITLTLDSLPARQTKRSKYPLFIACGGSAASSELPPEASFNCYNIISIKWLPGANQFRCHVETRKLVDMGDAGRLITPEWTWTQFNYDDRSFRPEQAISVGEQGSWRPFNNNDDDPDKDDDSMRKKQYALSRYMLPVVAFRPSLTPGQASEAIVELREHAPLPDDVLPEDAPQAIRSVRWTAGRRHDVCDLQRNSDPYFRAVFSYYGPMLIQGFITWEDGRTANVFIYAHMEEIE
jgi:3',5'-cyclic AMP phosphodiesterase CpdA